MCPPPMGFFAAGVQTWNAAAPHARRRTKSRAKKHPPYSWEAAAAATPSRWAQAPLCRYGLELMGIKGHSNRFTTPPIRISPRPAAATMSSAFVN